MVPGSIYGEPLTICYLYVFDLWREKETNVKTINNMKIKIVAQHLF